MSSLLAVDRQVPEGVAAAGEASPALLDRVPQQARPDRSYAVAHPEEDRLPDLAAVRSAAWRVPRVVLVGAVATLLVSTLAGLSVALGDEPPSAEYFSTLAGGLMALAGIVPGVIGFVVVGKPVTRLDGGRVLLDGWIRCAAWLYAAVWLLALVPPLIALASHWGEGSPVWAGIQLGLVLLVTLVTPLVLLGLTARLQPRESTTLAVDRAVVAHGLDGETMAGRLSSRLRGRGADRARRRVDVVRDLRDIALSEHEAGDRRAVKQRMTGLAAVAVLSREEEVCRAAVDELGLVCAQVVADRELALDGLNRLEQVALDLARGGAGRGSRVALVLKEVVDVWEDALSRGASSRVVPRVVEVLSRLLAAVELEAQVPVLERVLGLLPTSTRREARQSLEDLEQLTRSCPFDRLPETQGTLLRAWLALLESVGSPALGTVSARYLRPYEHRLPPSQFHRRELTEVLVRMVRRAVDEHGLTCRELRPLLSEALRAVGPAPLLTLAERALAQGDGDPADGVLLAEVVLLLPQMSTEQAGHVIKAVDKLPLATTLVAAPALLPVLHRHVDRLLEPRVDIAQQETAWQLDHGGTSVVLLVTAITREVLRAGVDDSAEGRAALALVARLLRRSGACAVGDAAADVLRRRLAAQLQQLPDPHRAADRLRSVLPLFLQGESVYARSWLAWLDRYEDEAEREASVVSIHPAVLPRLLDLALEDLVRAEDELIPVPDSDPLYGGTVGQARQRIMLLVRDLLLTTQSSRHREALKELKEWWGSSAEPLARRQALLDALLPAAERPWQLHVAALDLGLLGRKLWLPPRSRDWAVLLADPLHDADWAFVCQELAGEVPLLDQSAPSIVEAALTSLCVAWVRGTMHGRAVDSSSAAVVVRLMQERASLRGQVTAALRAAARPPLSRRFDLDGDLLLAVVPVLMEAKDLRGAAVLLPRVAHAAPLALEGLARTLVDALEGEDDEAELLAVAESIISYLTRAPAAYISKSSRRGGNEVLATMVLDVAARLAHLPRAVDAADRLRGQSHLALLVAAGTREPSATDPGSEAGDQA